MRLQCLRLQFLSLILTGHLCEENIDDCASDLGGPRCFNGGQCIDQVGGYSCHCLPGFAGERCEGDINECLSNPCSPHGSLDCLQLINDYTCICRSAFTGEYLETLSQFPIDLSKTLSLLFCPSVGTVRLSRPFP